MFYAVVPCIELEKILFVSVYILSLNRYKPSDREMWQYKVTAEGMGARYKRNMLVLILLYVWNPVF